MRSPGKREFRISTKTGFLLVTLAWVFLCLLGALPYYCSGVLPGFVDAVFESVSGFTTTGATVIADVEALGRPILFWRGFTHWIGGMGIVVLTVAILPLLGAGGFHLFQAESPGPESGRITPRIRSAAKILWFIYLALTLAETVLLRLFGMNWFDALIHSFSTMATGGFSTRNRSIAAYDSPAIEWVCILFMFLAGFNFGLIYRFLQGKYREIRDNSEARVYGGIITIAAALCLFSLLPRMPLAGGLRRSLFQVLSVLTTTGFSAADHSLWPPAAQACLFFLMFIGGCSSSTSGGIKVIRHVVLFKQMGNEFKRLLNPRGVFSIQLNRRPGKKEMVYGVAGFVFLYFVILLASTVVFSAAGLNILTALNLSLLSLGNIGLGLGQSDFGPIIYNLPVWAKYGLCFIMIAGRLELWTVFVLFSREWRRR
jgi:trk system potassium uptake protein TrkH